MAVCTSTLTQTDTYMCSFKICTYIYYKQRNFIIKYNKNNIYIYSTAEKWTKVSLYTERALVQSRKQKEISQQESRDWLTDANRSQDNLGYRSYPPSCWRQFFCSTLQCMQAAGPGASKDPPVSALLLLCEDMPASVSDCYGFWGFELSSLYLHDNPRAHCPTLVFYRYYCLFVDTFEPCLRFLWEDCPCHLLPNLMILFARNFFQFFTAQVTERLSRAWPSLALCILVFHSVASSSPLTASWEVLEWRG